MSTYEKRIGGGEIENERDSSSPPIGLLAFRGFVFSFCLKIWAQLEEFNVRRERNMFIREEKKEEFNEMVEQNQDDCE